MEADMEDYDSQIGRLDYEKEKQVGLLYETRGKEAEAQMKYESLRGEQQSFLNSIRVPRTKEILCSDLSLRLMRVDSFSPWEIGLSVVSFGWSRFRSGVAARDIKHFQEETDSRKRAADEYESNIAEAQVSLQNLSGKSARMVSSEL